MFGLGTLELVIILLVALLIFGSSLPYITRSFGKNIRGFRDALRDVEADVKGDGAESAEGPDRK